MRTLGRAALFTLLTGLYFTSSGKAEVSLSFQESADGTYLRPAAENWNTELDVTSFVGLTSALLNLGSTAQLTSEQSEQINSLIQASPFERPQALLLLAVAGADQDIVDSGRSIKADEGLLQGVTTLKTLDTVEQIQLDTSSIPGCGEACLEQLLTQANAELGLNASYASAQSPLRGVWTFRTQEGNAVTLNLAEVSDRLVALEVASFWVAIKDSVNEMQRRGLQNPGLRFQPQLLSRVFISPHMIRESYGPSSDQYKAVLAIFKATLAQSIKQLETASEDRIVTTVISLDSISDSQLADLWALTAPSSPLSMSRRKLLQGGSNDDSSFLNNFIAWVSMWGTFFLLLFFALTGCHCLKSLKFKQDSLLYGKNKSD